VTNPTRPRPPITAICLCGRPRDVDVAAMSFEPNHADAQSRPWRGWTADLGNGRPRSRRRAVGAAPDDAVVLLVGPGRKPERRPADVGMLKQAQGSQEPGRLLRGVMSRQPAKLGGLVARCRPRAGRRRVEADQDVGTHTPRTSTSRELVVVRGCARGPRDVELVRRIRDFRVSSSRLLGEVVLDGAGCGGGAGTEEDRAECCRQVDSRCRT